MKAIENTSLALLAAAIIFVGLVGGAFFLDRYTTYVPPATPGASDFSFEKTLRESSNLEGVKQMCLRLAENEDDSRKFNVALYQRFNAMTREMAVMLAMSFTVFGCGLAYIYVVARRLRLGHGAQTP
jgi:hypothetical protein